MPIKLKNNYHSIKDMFFQLKYFSSFVAVKIGERWKVLKSFIKKSLLQIDKIQHLNDCSLWLGIEFVRTKDCWNMADFVHLKREKKSAEKAQIKMLGY